MEHHIPLAAEIIAEQKRKGRIKDGIILALSALLLGLTFINIWTRRRTPEV